MKQGLIIYGLFLIVQVVLTACDHPSSETMSEKRSESEISLFEGFLSKIDGYMDSRAYDSAQMVLNDYSEKLLFRQPDIYSYILSSRQSEIYYYNNLHQLGLQEAQKAEMIARNLQNNSLLLDAYNFEGLFYTNLDSMEKAFESFFSGAKYCQDSIFYLSERYYLSRPYHLFGNLAEAYYKINQLDSSIYYARISQKLAKEAKKDRAVSIADIQLGDVFLKQKEIDSAVYYYESAMSLLSSQPQIDVTLLALGNLAAAKFTQQESKLPYKYLTEGYQIMEDDGNINPYYQEQFLLKAKEVYQAKGDYQHLSMTMDKIASLYEKVHDAASLRYLEVAMSGLKKESRILNMEVEKANQAKKLANTRLLIIVLILVILVIIFLMYRFYSRQKLGMANLRNEISQDLHDEVGATLSGIALYSHIIRNQVASDNTQKAYESLNVIEKNATEMVRKLSDIIWAVTPKYDDLDNLLTRLYEFSLEISSAKSIKVTLEKPELKGIKLNMEQRKNLYLICKEAVNNAVKYSECENISISVIKENQLLKISVKDDGKGFCTNEIKRGNGLDNIQSRANEMNAQLEIISSEKGTEIIVNFKIT